MTIKTDLEIVVIRSVCLLDEKNYKPDITSLIRETDLKAFRHLDPFLRLFRLCIRKNFTTRFWTETEWKWLEALLSFGRFQYWPALSLFISRVTTFIAWSVNNCTYKTYFQETTHKSARPRGNCKRDQHYPLSQVAWILKQEKKGEWKKTKHSWPPIPIYINT